MNLVDSLEFVYRCIEGCVDFLLSWSFRGIPFLIWLIGFVIVGTVMKFIFG